MIAWRQNAARRAFVPPPRPASVVRARIAAVRPLAIERQSLVPLPGLSLTAIQGAVEAYYGLAPGSIIRRSRAVRFAHPRQLAMYLCRTLTDRSYPAIGRAFGGRDHSTVIHAIRAVEARLLLSPDVRTAYAAILEALKV